MGFEEVNLLNKLGKALVILDCPDLASMFLFQIRGASNDRSATTACEA
jgi:hypothetical protein